VAKTHYEVLGIGRNSTEAQIRSAYRRLVLKHHPDHSKDPRSAEIFSEVRNAYEALSDPSRRRSYDLSLEAKPRGPISPPPAPPKPTTAPKPTKKPKAPTVTDDLLRLTTLFNRSRYAEAEKLAFKILEKHPREAIPYGILGDISRARGDLSQAANMYAHAVQADPRNQLYQQRYEELILASRPKTAVAKNSHPGNDAAALGVGGAVCLVSLSYIALGKEAPLLPAISLISTWSLGLVVMLFLCGVTAGATLSISGRLDRFSSVSTTALGGISPAMALATIAIVNFWGAAALYAVLGLSQNAFNYSTSRLIGAVAMIVAVASLAAVASDRLNPMQVLLWGGNLSYMGGICGWMVTDSLRRV
jgi:tetratricopeptide (TPR) repeat protein